MSLEDETRRAEIVARLEELQYEIHIDCLYLSPIEMTSGNQFRVQSAPFPDEWSFESRRELWKLSAPLVRNGKYNEGETHDGLAKWLFDRSQQFVGPMGCTGRLANPVQVWTNGLRERVEPGPDVACACRVNGDPRLATEVDLYCVAAKASLLVNVLRDQCEKLQKLESNIERRRYRSRELTESERRYHEMREREIRWANWNLAEWGIYADIVAHYASALIPEDFSKCPQLARRAWMRRDFVDWPKLEQEFLLLSNRLHWLKPPSKATESLSEPVAYPVQESRIMTQTESDGLASLRRSTATALNAALQEMNLAKQQATTLEELRLRLNDSAVQAARAVAHAADNGLYLPGEEMFPLFRKPLTDENALTGWKMSICPAVRYHTPAVKGSAGEHDFPKVLQDKNGMVLGTDGKPLEKVIETDSDGNVVSASLSGIPANILNGCTEAQLLTEERRKAADWSFTVTRLIEMIEDHPPTANLESSNSGIETSTPVKQVSPPKKKRGRRLKLNDPMEDSILRTYKRLRNTKATVEHLKLQPKGKISALNRVKLVVARDRQQQSRAKKRRDNS